jgi:hypothetical protein
VRAADGSEEQWVRLGSNDAVKAWIHNSVSPSRGRSRLQVSGGPASWRH